MLCITITLCCTPTWRRPLGEIRKYITIKEFHACVRVYRYFFAFHVFFDNKYFHPSFINLRRLKLNEWIVCYRFSFRRLRLTSEADIWETLYYFGEPARETVWHLRKQITRQSFSKLNLVRRRALNAGTAQSQQTQFKMVCVARCSSVLVWCNAWTHNN